MNYIASSDSMTVNNEVERMSKEAVVAKFKALSRNYPYGIAENRTPSVSVPVEIGTGHHTTQVRSITA
jgi:hypothetical protein